MFKKLLGGSRGDRMKLQVKVIRQLWKTGSKFSARPEMRMV